LDLINSLWIEKYRPKKIEDIVLPENYKTDFQTCIKKNEIPSLLFSGNAGSGKTATARVICSKEGIIQNRSDNVLDLNGSAKETRNINYVNEVIEPYLKIPPANPDKYKIVFIDEADYLTDSAFSALRNIMEKYSQHARFIFTCNYISKIPEAIQSRCQHYIFKRMPVDFVFDYCKHILDTEKITFDEKDLKHVITSLYPDIRRIVGELQKNSHSGKLNINKNLILSTEKMLISSFVEIVNFIQNNEDHKINGIINNMVKLLGESDLDFRSVYNDLFFRKEVPTTAKILINKYANSHNDCLLPNNHFFALVFEIVQALQKYKQLVGKK